VTHGKAMRNLIETKASPSPVHLPLLRLVSEPARSKEKCMKSLPAFFSVFFAFSFAAMAADPAARTQAPAPPPPGMDDPGVPAQAAKLTVDETNETKDANGAAAPTVSVRTQGGDTVEEYRQDGRITMIKITPKKGLPQTFVSSPDGKLVRDVKQGPVDPVYFTVYQWK
jgi:hypothetical protein